MPSDSTSEQHGKITKLECPPTAAEGSSVCCSLVEKQLQSELGWPNISFAIHASGLKLTAQTELCYVTPANL
jgi:hypothetical protein